jgi:hypothetical protein
MSKTISVFTKNSFLFQKIRLDAPEGVTVALRDADADLILIDKDTEDIRIDGALTMSRKDLSADISIPFRLGEIKRLLSDASGNEALLKISDSGRLAILRGEKIKLTELEASLLSALIKRRGGYASREEILCEVWSAGSDPGIINVYIHYLRDKLEKHGEKIIISSRKCGYKIDEKYLGGNGNAQNN